jgi:hypothetical protein
MGQPLSDAVFELHGVCIHSLRFAFGAPLEYPYAPGRLAQDNPPPALFRRLQAVSPPPTRDGEPWQSGMTLDGKPFQPSEWSDRLAEVEHDEGLPSLDVADPGNVVLDSGFTVPRSRKTVAFPGPDHGKYLTSIGYWSPIPKGATEVRKDVEYYDTYRLEWTRAPQTEWVAISFDAFWPPERDSADVILRLGKCDAECPRPE